MGCDRGRSDAQTSRNLFAALTARYADHDSAFAFSQVNLVRFFGSLCGRIWGERWLCQRKKARKDLWLEKRLSLCCPTNRAQQGFPVDIFEQITAGADAQSTEHQAQPIAYDQMIINYYHSYTPLLGSRFVHLHIIPSCSSCLRECTTLRM